MNIKRRTLNPEHRMIPRGVFVRCSAFDVRRSVFLFLLSSVAPLLGQAATDPLPLLAPPYSPMPPTFWEQHGPAVIAGSVALILVAGLGLWWIGRPKPPMIVPPEVQAREALAGWLDRPEDGSCLSSVSQILRRYVARAFAFPAGEFTTAEFCRQLARNEKMGVELTQAIAGFLQECDRRKFSARNPNAPMNAVSRALEIVELAERQRERPGAAKHD